MLSERAEAEKKRLNDLLAGAGISERRIKVLRPVIENTAWMKVKLDDARETIKNSQVAIPYDNGGGQKGIRENPIFKGYEALWKSYMLGMNRIIDCLPAEQIQTEIKEMEKPKTMLELVRDKHRA